MGVTRCSASSSARSRCCCRSALAVDRWRRPRSTAASITLKRNLDELLQRYTDKHPDVIGARRPDRRSRGAEADAARGHAGIGRVASSARSDANPLRIEQTEARRWRRPRSRVASLRARVAEFAVPARSAAERCQAHRPSSRRSWPSSTATTVCTRATTIALVARRESANIAAEMSTQTGIADFRVIDPPTLPTKPSAPNRLLLLPLAALVGLAAGFALTFLISQLRPAFSDPRQLREVTGLPVLGTGVDAGNARAPPSPRRRPARLRGWAGGLCRACCRRGGGLAI